MRAHFENGESEAPDVGIRGVVLANDPLRLMRQAAAVLANVRESAPHILLAEVSCRYGHVRDRSHERDGLSDRVLDLSADAKIRDLHLASAVEEEVLRLDVAMDEMEVLVDVVYSVQELVESPVSRSQTQRSIEQIRDTCMEIETEDFFLYIYQRNLLERCKK